MSINLQYVFGKTFRPGGKDLLCCIELVLVEKSYQKAHLHIWRRFKKKSTTILDALEWDQKPLCLNILMLDWCKCISATETRGTTFSSSFCFLLLFMESRFQKSSQKTEAVYDIWCPDMLLQNHVIINFREGSTVTVLKGWLLFTHNLALKWVVNSCDWIIESNNTREPDQPNFWTNCSNQFCELHQPFHW